MMPSIILNKLVIIEKTFFYNDGHVLQLRPETVAIHRRMSNGLDDYDGQMVSGNKLGLNLMTFVLQLRENPRKKP